MGGIARSQGVAHAHAGMDLRRPALTIKRFGQEYAQGKVEKRQQGMQE